MDLKGFIEHVTRQQKGEAPTRAIMHAGGLWFCAGNNNAEAFAAPDDPKDTKTALYINHFRGEDIERGGTSWMKIGGHIIDIKGPDKISINVYTAHAHNAPYDSKCEPAKDWF